MSAGKPALKRPKLKQDDESEAPADNYFSSEKDLPFVSTGCTILDCIMGGGYVLGRMANIIGDKSTAKTGLAMEALANFAMEYPDGKMKYKDVESAFDIGYAEAMGMPVDRVMFKPRLDTVEDMYRDLDAFIEKRLQTSTPGLYIIDSMDALTSEAEMGRDISKDSFGGEKAKKLGEMFRKLVRPMEEAQVGYIIVSQVRDNIGAMFGEKHRRTGGKALDFYASQFLWLAHIGQVKAVINKIERPVGIRVKAQVKKNKVGLPFRSCEFVYVFGYGVDDVRASIEYLDSVNRLSDADIPKSKINAYIKEVGQWDDDEYNKERRRLSKIVKRVFNEVETTFLPKRAKYG